MNEPRPLDGLNRARNRLIAIELVGGDKLCGNLKAFDLNINLLVAEAQGKAEFFIPGSQVKKITIH